MAADRTIAFDSFEVDYGRSELRCNGVPVEVEPQVFDLIAYFAVNSERLLSRDDLI
jgi:DNA-binding winged helix-turn-helix (wHTH) protein